MQPKPSYQKKTYPNYEDWEPRRRIRLVHWLALACICLFALGELWVYQSGQPSSPNNRSTFYSPIPIVQTPGTGENMITETGPGGDRSPGP